MELWIVLFVFYYRTILIQKFSMWVFVVLPTLERVLCLIHLLGRNYQQLVIK